MRQPMGDTKKRLACAAVPACGGVLGVWGLPQQAGDGGSVEST